MVLKITSDRYLMARALRYPIQTIQRRRGITTASRSEENHHEMKKMEITRIALQHMYEAPSLKEQNQITTKQLRLKMILHEALDLAHSICEQDDATECLWAWEMVDEIDDAATRAGVQY